MMKRLLLAIAFLATSSAASFAATCSTVSPQLKDNAGTTFNAPYVDDGTGSGDCVPKVSLLSVAVTAALNGTPSLANGNGVVPTQGGAVLSATNGMFTNVLQGNAVLSLTNPLFVTPATSASWAVTGTFYQATQPTSLASGQVASGAFASGAFATGSGTDGWNVTEGTKADAAWTSGSGSLVAVGKAIATAAVAPVPCLNATAQNTNTYTTGSTSPTNCDVNSNLYVNLGKNNGTAGTPSTAVLSTQGVSGGYPLSVTTNNAYPYGITPVNATATGTTAATTATIAGSGGAAFTFLCGFSIRANATAAATGNATITGSGTTSLKLVGTVAQVNASLATLSFTGSMGDQIAITTVDANSQAATPASIAVNVLPSANTYLLFNTQALALGRSQTQCAAVGCDGTKTVYWWNVIGPTKAGTIASLTVPAGSYALEIQGSGYYEKTVAVGPCAVGCGLSSTEQGQLVTAAQVASVMP